MYVVQKIDQLTHLLVGNNSKLKTQKTKNKNDFRSHKLLVRTLHSHVDPAITCTLSHSSLPIFSAPVFIPTALIISVYSPNIIPIGHDLGI